MLKKIIFTLSASALTLTSYCAVAGNGVQNNCSDPYWQSSLRCQFFPTQVPQPVPIAPTNISEIKDFTRVELTQDPGIRCVDGTRPILYVDKAVNGPSNNWIISMTGGDSCSASDLNQNGSYEDGQECHDFYIEQNTQFMGTANQSMMSNLIDENGNGILSSSPQKNPVFSNYNRVRVHKCGFDRHSGRATHLGVSATNSILGNIEYDLFNHGQKIVLAALDQLNANGAGMSYQTWLANGSGVITSTESLPSIANAEKIIIVGHSAAAHGLYQNADRYAAYLRALPNFSGDVRVIHDAHFMAAVENEAAFDASQNQNPSVINTLFDQRETGNNFASGNYNSARYHDVTFIPASRFSKQYRAWLETPLSSDNTILDASCVDMHLSTSDAWKCTDRFHVRFHHQSLPALIREDLSDPNGEHNNGAIGHIQWWGQLGTYPHCESILGAGTLICPPVLNAAQNISRMSIQAAHFREGLFTRSEQALNANQNDDPGSVFLWMPDCGDHSGVYSDLEFFQTGISKNDSFKSYREFMQDFVAAPAVGVMETRVNFLDGAVSECAPLLHQNGFE